MFPRGFGRATANRAPSKTRDNDLFDADAIAAFNESLPAASQHGFDTLEKHVDVCCGTMSHLVAHLERNPYAQGVAIDILPPDKVPNDGINPDVLARIQYVPMDVSHLTWRQFQNVVRDRLRCKPSQLTSVHFSPPCTTYTRAHHGKNPHRCKSVMQAEAFGRRV